MRARFEVLFLGLVSILVAGGCGGDDDESGGGPACSFETDDGSPTASCSRDCGSFSFSCQSTSGAGAECGCRTGPNTGVLFTLAVACDDPSELASGDQYCR